MLRSGGLLPAPDLLTGVNGDVATLFRFRV